MNRRHRSLALRIGFLVALVALVAIGYALRPLVHGVVYRAVYSPSGAIFVGITLLGALLLFFRGPSGGTAPSSDGATDGTALDELPIDVDELSSGDLSDPYERAATLFGVVVVIAAAIALAYGVPASMVEERTIAQETMDRADSVEEFPAVNADNPRIAPRAVADVQTRGSVSYRQYRLGTSDIARTEDGRLAWSYPVQPDGFRNRLFERQQGVVMSDMTRMEDREIAAIDDASFAVGEGMALHRSADWNLKKTGYWSQYRDDAIEFTHDGEPYLAYPKTGHEWHLSPIPHTAPTWDGVALIHPDGTIEHLSPSEAQDSEILAGQRLYPLYNTEREMESLGYREGIVNQLPGVGSHENEVEIAGLPAGAGNSQPFVIDLEGERMSYVTAMEPYGEDTRGLDEVWFTDARTGEYTYYGTGSDTLTGPERAMGIVRSEDTQTGWGDDFEVVEPVPVTVDERLWWHSKVVPTDNTDISRNVFVDAHSGEAVELYATDSVREFLAGEDPEAVADGEDVDTEPADDDPDVAYSVVITDENGEEVDRIPVEPGQEVTIVDDGDAGAGEDDGDGAANSSDDAAGDGTAD